MAAERKVLTVTNITHSATEAELSDLFSIAGNVSRATIIQSGFPYYGFVEYSNAGDARRAINLSGKFFGPSKITVAYSTQPFPPQPLIPAPAPPQMIQNQGHQYNQGPRDLFNQGPRPSDNQYPNQGPRPIDNQYLNQGPRPSDNQYLNQPQQGMQQTVQFNKPSFGSDAVTEVLLSNVPVALKEHNLHQLFSGFGSIVDATLIKDASGLATGKGKVSFASLENASMAASSMNGKRLEGSYIPLGCVVKDNNSQGNSDRGNRADLRANRQDLRANRQDLRANLQSQNTHTRHHPYQHNNQQQQQFSNMNPMASMRQGPPPPQQQQQQQYHQHFDNASFGQPQQSTFNIHGGATHSFAASPNAPPQQQQRAAVYVGNVPETSCKNCLLYQLFAPYGAITSVKAMETKNESKDGRGSGWFGFVNYKDFACANLAILTLDKSTLDGQVLKVVMKSEKPGLGKNQNRRSLSGFMKA